MLKSNIFKNFYIENEELNRGIFDDKNDRNSRLYATGKTKQDTIFGQRLRYRELLQKEKEEDELQQQKLNL